MSLRRPQTTVRWRLTLLYAGLFLVCGAALLAITYTLVDRATVGSGPPFTRLLGSGGAPVPLPGVKVLAGSSVTIAVHGARTNGLLPRRLPAQVRRLLTSHAGKIATHFVVSAQRISDLHQLVIESLIALAIMALISAALGWVVAGRVLRPLRTITAAAQEISEASLDRRLAMRGPRDELRLLADTIDGLLRRLEGSFEAQRRFVANASHELRTPLTAVRALLEMAIGDPDATVQTFRETCAQVLDESAREERLIDALLALAQGQRGLTERQPIDLAAVAGDALRARRREAEALGLALHSELAPATVSGDRRLIERLASNLLDNALRHNVPGGTVEVTVSRSGHQATLGVHNSGPAVPADQIPRLVQPFQRLVRERVGHGVGLGLGLSIVAAIAATHGAELSISPRTGGGLDVEVVFRAAGAIGAPDAPGEPAVPGEPA